MSVLGYIFIPSSESDWRVCEPKKNEELSIKGFNNQLLGRRGINEIFLLIWKIKAPLKVVSFGQLSLDNILLLMIWNSRRGSR